MKFSHYPQTIMLMLSQGKFCLSTETTKNKMTRYSSSLTSG